MHQRRARTIAGAVTCAGLIAGGGAALAQEADIELLRELNITFNRSEGDEGGFGGQSVDATQCAPGPGILRCVIAEVQGTTNIDTGASSNSSVPFDTGVATREPDGRITTRREPFAEPVVPFDAEIEVRDRQRQTSTGNLLVQGVEAGVPVVVQITTVVDVEQDGLSFEGGVRSTRTVALSSPEDPVPVSARLSDGQKARLKRLLRTKRSVLTTISVEVRGDVGPAEAVRRRLTPVRVVRR